MVNAELIHSPHLQLVRTHIFWLESFYSAV